MSEQFDPFSVQEQAWLVRNLLPPEGRVAFEAIVARVRDLERRDAELGLRAELAGARAEADRLRAAAALVVARIDGMLADCCDRPGAYQGFCESYGCSTLRHLRAALVGGG